jgi:hypothetical protein
MPNTFTPSAVERVEISCSKGGSLSIRLEFNDYHPGFDLDFFTLNSMLCSEFYLIFTKILYRSFKFAVTDCSEISQHSRSGIYRRNCE